MARPSRHVLLHAAAILVLHAAFLAAGYIASVFHIRHHGVSSGSNWDSQWSLHFFKHGNSGWVENGYNALLFDVVRIQSTLPETTPSASSPQAGTPITGSNLQHNGLPQKMSEQAFTQSLALATTADLKPIQTNPSILDSTLILQTRVGWPLRIGSSLIYTKPGSARQSHIVRGLRWPTATSQPSSANPIFTPLSQEESLIASALPLSLSIPALIINSLFYLVITAFILTPLLRSIKSYFTRRTQRRRQARNLCTACGYPMPPRSPKTPAALNHAAQQTPSPKCPECGLLAASAASPT